MNLGKKQVKKTDVSQNYPFPRNDIDNNPDMIFKLTKNLHTLGIENDLVKIVTEME